MLKRLPVETLETILRTLVPNYQIEVNDVGNLRVLDKHGNYLGFIDMRTGLVESAAAIPSNER